MRCKLLFMLLIAVVACGAGPRSGQNIRMNNQLYPSVTGPGPGVIASGDNLAPFNMGNVQPNAQINFQGTPGMNINWDTVVIGGFDSEPLVCPGFQNFEMGRVYRLRLSNIANEEGLTLYPTLEINQMTPRTRAYLEHNAVPVTFTNNDFDQVKAGHFVTKVIFLPAPEFQNLAVSCGVDTIVNTQLPAGTDPVVEAQKRGAVLAVIRIGNKDLALPGSLDAGQVGNGHGPGGVPQIPISGVNIPNYGTPNTVTPYGVTGPAVLPPAGAGYREKAKGPVNVMPSTNVPQNRAEWSGNQF